MDLWLDNTALHAAGRCLDGAARSRADAQSLLNLGEQLVLCRQLVWTGFESSEVRERSDEIRRNLVRQGVGSQQLSVAEVAPSRYKSACLSAALRAAYEFDTLLAVQPPESDEILPDLTPIRGAPDVEIHQLITDPQAEPYLDELANSALKEKAAGAVLFMLSAEHRLWKRLVQSAQSEPWSPQRTLQLAAMLRILLNQELAVGEQLYYAPSASRAELLRSRTNEFVADVSRVVGQAAEELARRTIPLPRIAGILVTRAKGEPHALIEIAMEVRRELTTFRKHFYTLVQALNLDSPSGWAKARSKLATMATLILQELGLHESPRSWEAVSVAYPTAVEISPSSLVSSLKHHWERKRIAFLTHLTCELAHAEHSELYYRRFLKRCGLQAL